MNPACPPEVAAELEDLRQRLAEAEETLDAIRNGEADGLVIAGPQGPQVFTLQGAQEPYRLLIEQMSEGALTLARDGVILYANQTFAGLLQLPPGRVIGAALRDFLTTADQPILAGLIEAAWGGSSRGEVTARAADGSMVPLRLGLSRLRLGAETLVCAVATDITERKAQEEALRVSELRWKFAIEGAGDGLWDWNVPASTVFFSPRWKTMLGFAEAEIGNNLEEWSKRVHPDDLARVMMAVQAHLAGTTPSYVNEHRLRCQDGSWKWILDRGLVVERDAAGQPLRVIGTHSDITARKQAEAAALESETRFTVLADAAPVLIWESGLDKLCTYFNKVWLDFTGRSLAQEMGNGWAEGVHPDDLARCLETYVSSFDARQEFKMEYRLRRHDGEYRWLLDHGVPRYQPEGRLAGYVGSCVDITDGKLAEEKLARTSELLEVTGALAKVGGWEVNLETMKLSWTRETFRIAELEPPVEPPLEQGINLFAPEARPTMTAAIQAAITTGTSYDLELPLITGRGRPRWVQTQGFAEMRDGKAVRLYGTFQDITERRQAEEKLRASEGRFRALAETSPLAIYLSVGLGQEARYLNPAFIQLFGYTLVEVPTVAHWWPLAYPDEDYRRHVVDEWQRKVAQALASHSEIEPLEVVVTCKDGSQKNILWGFKTLGEENWAFGLDVTERKQAEAASRSFASYTRSLLEASLDPLVTISAEGKITDVNDASVQATGLPRASLIGTDFSDYFTAPAKAREGYERVFLEGFVRDYPLTLRHVTGRVTEVLYNAAVYRDEQGQVRGVFAAARDITERQQAEAKVRALLEQAQRDAHANAELLKEVNHRVKNNLLAILGLALAEQRHASTEEKPVARRITGNLRRRLEGLLEVHQMLSASQWAPMAVNQLARRIIESALGAVPAGCQVTLALAPSAGLVSPRQASNLALVLNELATNTIKYALAGRTTARITLATTSTEATLRLDYRDDGPGYPAAVLSQEGLNTGLELVRDITTQTLRGRLTLANDAGAVTVLEIMAEEIYRT